MHTFSRPSPAHPLRRLAPLVLVAVLAACTPATDTAGAGAAASGVDGSRPAAAQEVALQQFDGCDDLGDELRRRAIAQVTPYGVGSGYGMAVNLEAGVASDASGRAAPQASAAEDSATGADGAAQASSTNVQVAGVDEPDIVKTDGAYVYALTETTVRIIDVRGDRADVVSTIDLTDGYPNGLLLRDGRLLVLGIANQPMLRGPQGDAGAGADIAASSFIAPSGTRLWSIDVSDPTVPTVTSTSDLEGDLVAARLVDDTARVIIRSVPVPTGFVQPDGLTDEQDALAENRARVTTTSAQDWLPRAAIGGAAAAPMVDCAAVRAPRDGTDLGIVSVLSLDITAPELAPDRVDAVLGAAQTVYADADSLYVSTTRWPQVLPVEPIPMPAVPEGDLNFRSFGASTRDAPRPLRQQITTDVHRFDLDADGATYVASGTVPGTVLNQWALSEHDDVLRIATTIDPVGLGEADDGGESRSAVHMLRRERDRLVEIGKVDDLGRGERIYAVRYIGDLGLVVTFREIDPLYTLDLSDPTAPQVLGELKIPGYSAYLHPVGEDHLLGIGQDADRRGRTRGVQVSLFDIGDLAAPKRVATLPQGEQTSTPVEYDHRALLAWPDRNLYVLPVERWDTGQADMAVITAADDGRLAQRGRIALPGPAWFGGGQGRTVVVGERLITVAPGGAVVHDIDTLDERKVITWP